MSTREELELMSRVARLYYQDELTQQEIASQLGISRPTISRLLGQARREGIVQITIVDPFQAHTDLEAELMDVFGLTRAVVVGGEGLDSDQLRRRIGFAAADYLQCSMPENARVGIGWGRTLQAMVQALDGDRPAGIRVHPLIGGVGQISASFQVNKLAEQLARTFGGEWLPFYVPAFVGDPVARKGLLALSDVEAVLHSWETLDLALVGIGHFALQRQSSMFFASYMTPETLSQLEKSEAVGDICGRFFDIHGRFDYPEQGVIGIPLTTQRTVENVIGIAGGSEKVPAILGALRGRFLKTLVTDTVTAAAVLEYNGTQR